MSILEGWPPNWYDDSQNLICISEHCDFIYKSSEVFYKRNNHLREDKPAGGMRAMIDHTILFWMCKETDCPSPSCDFHNTKHVKELFLHEVTSHGSQDLSTIEGFVKLVRRGHAVDTEAKVAIFDRLRQKVLNSSAMLRPLTRYVQLRAQPGPLQRPSLSGHDLLVVLSPPAERQFANETPPWEPVDPENFLMYLEPVDEDPRAVWWRPVWEKMRSDYQEGRI
ncbi:hypothetical protein MMC28_004502 [Mycoblastus sanguinarius]|nr:hypothetical protein [Mycoblastus sanguinarius]